MAIVQISKIQQRAGNLVDLPQLDNAEFGWATDENRLFIGRTGNSFADENIEVLTSYSNISFSQINGSDSGNFNIVAAQNGQILTYVSSTDTWENYTGANSQLGGTKLQLGDVANISMLGGAIAYILETDGLGNLSWTPKGTLYTNIKAVSSANPIVMTVPNTTPYVNGTSVTITGVAGTNANSIVNGRSFYITLANDYPTSGNVKLYTDISRTIGANGSTMTATANTGVATAIIVGASGSGTGQAAGSNTTVQFNDQNISNGVASFTFDKTTTTLTVSTGNIITGNVNANTSITAPSLVSNIAIGTAPITVTSTTLVPNLFVARANVSEYSNTALTTTGTWYPIFVNATSGNLAQGANANFSFNAATGNLSTTLLNVTSNANTGNLGTSTLIATTGNITTINSGLMKNSTSNITIASAGNISHFVAGNATSQLTVTATGANIPGTANVVGNLTAGNVNAGNLLTANYLTGTLTTAAQPNITSVGTLTGLTSTGVINLTGASNVSLGAIGNLKITGGSNTQVLQTDGAGNLSWANSAGGYYLHTQSSANTVWTVVHNLNNQYVSVEPIDNTGNSYTGRYDFPIVHYTNANALTLTFSSAVNGWAAVVGGGYTNATTVTPTPSGFDTYVQYNNAGNLGSNSAFTFTVASGKLSATLFAGSGANLTNIPGGNVTGAVTYATTANAVAGGNVSGQVSNALVAGTVYTAAQGNITSVGTLTGLTLANAAIISVGSNTNVGTFTGNFSLSAGSRLNATYADLAEYYEADKPYEPGTVVEFGGAKEVTIAEDGTTRVAGVVSTNPAYVMNSTCKGQHIVALALQGRVPCKVRGTIHKGDMLVSGGDGYARPMIHPYIGSVIGKSLENFEGEGVIEVAVGRL